MSDGLTVEEVAAKLIRDWADRRLLADPLNHRGSRERIVLTQEERELFEQCADDVERGVR